MSPELTTHLISIAIGIVSGVAASYLFVKLFVYSKVPKIEISDFISNIEHRKRNSYMFKFVNKTDVPIFDVRLELTLMVSEYAPDNGKNMVNKDILLNDNFLSYIPKEDNKDVHNLHAYRIHTFEDLHELWDNNQTFLRLTIIAKHSKTSLSSITIKDFRHKSCIKPHEFQQGNLLGVVKS